ncbi:MAG: DUF192 domain-containing protein [Achromobacter sp.]|nr:DUF192 domain-containing protein [Achromobacter sp.]
MNHRDPPPLARLRFLRVDGWKGRMRGLLGRRPIGMRSGVMLMRCAGVHTFGMRYALDVAFVSRDLQVMAVRRALPPCRIALCLGAIAVVEMRAGVIDAEHGGIGRIEAAIQRAARRDIERDLQGAGQLRRQPHINQQTRTQVDEQKDQRPSGAIHQEGPLIAPAGDAREEQRLHQPQAVPGDQHRRMPEQRGDHDVDDGEDGQWHAHRHQDRIQGPLDRRNAIGLGHRIHERQEGQQAGGHAQAGIQKAHDEQLSEHARLLEGFAPHRRQHDPVRFDVLARRQRHEGDDGHESDDQDGAHRGSRAGEDDQKADEHGPGEHGQGLLAEQAEAVSNPLPAGCRGEECCLHGSLKEDVSQKGTR